MNDDDVTFVLEGAAPPSPERIREMKPGHIAFRDIGIPKSDSTVAAAAKPHGIDEKMAYSTIPIDYTIEKEGKAAKGAVQSVVPVPVAMAAPLAPRSKGAAVIAIRR